MPRSDRLCRPASRGYLMRRWLLAAVVTVVIGGGPGIGVGAAAAAPGPGTYTTPFREDGAAFVDGTFRGGHYGGQATDGNGWVAGPVAGAPDGNPDAYNCLPAAASLVQLADGRLLYWNALEASENVAGTN